MGIVVNKYCGKAVHVNTSKLSISASAVNKYLRTLEHKYGRNDSVCVHVLRRDLCDWLVDGLSPSDRRAAVRGLIPLAAALVRDEDQ